MCGINGIHAYHYAANPVDRLELSLTSGHMAARGPDASGEWFTADGRVAFGHRRLSIIDLSLAGAQPMSSADGRLTVTFNGEIYNHRALREELEAGGAIFRSGSDTEVLLHLYAAKGDEMVHDLRGMFAFAIWDARRERLLLARDPYGIKPLYYADDGWTFRFASQVKALLAGGAVSREADPAGQVGFFLFGSVPEPFTTVRAIRSLPAGTTLVVDRLGAATPRRYHSVAAVYRRAEDKRLPVADDVATVREALLDSVRSHLVADVPVGAFLSAGIDSGALVGLMRDAGADDIQTITIGFEEFRGQVHDETPLAADVAALYGTRHTQRIVTRTEFEADLPRIVVAMDQPSIDGVNTWFVAKAARECGLKVAISGLGGDELFGGYPSFRDLPRWTGMLGVPSRLPLLGLLCRLVGSAAAGPLGISPKAAGLLELGGTYAGAYLLRRGLYMPWELNQVLDRDVVAQGLRRLAPLELIGRELRPCPRRSFDRVAALESALYMRNQLLRDTDWASMAHSLEVRVPLVDPVLLSRLAPVGVAARTKAALAGAPSRPLPAVIAGRRKTGFTTPIAKWMRTSALVAGSSRPTPSPHRPWARDWSMIVGRLATDSR